MSTIEIPLCDECHHEVNRCRCDNKRPLKDDLLPGYERLTLDRVALTIPCGEEVPYGSFGYLITEDGTVYVLLHEFMHGLVSTMLFPEIAKAKGFYAPIRPVQNNSVFYYQDFEIDHGGELSVVRIAPSRYIAPASVSKGHKPATKEQIESVRKCFAALNIRGRTEINTPLGDKSVSQCYEFLSKDKEDYYK